jgi:hypothetical protein
MHSADFLTHLEPNDLVLEAIPLVMWDLGVADNMDDIAQFLWMGGPRLPQASARSPKDRMALIVDERPDKKYWQMVKEELTVFLCTNDKKYKELWSRINALEGKGTHAIVMLLSGYLSEKFGLQTTLLASFVAVFLFGILKIGKEAYCRLACPK